MDKTLDLMAELANWLMNECAMAGEECTLEDAYEVLTKLSAYVSLNPGLIERD